MTTASCKRNMAQISGTKFFQAGFQEVTLTSLIFPASVAIYAIRT